jgi:hypothetical protein
VSQPLDDLRAPTLLSLADEDLTADLPIQSKQLLRGVDASLEIGEPGA